MDLEQTSGPGRAEQGVASAPLIRDFSTARATSALMYFTGRPCLRGHLSMRYTTNRACVSCDSLHGANYREKHPDRYRTRVSKWRAEHLEYHRVSSANWRKIHLEQERARNLVYKRTHRAVINAQTANYAHRKRANGGYFSRAAWEHLKALFGQCCAYCKRRMQRLTIDHIIPISKGGWHVSFNIVPACRSCNSKKGAHVIA